MADDTVHLSLLGQLLRRRWRFFAAVAVLGALAGAGVWVVISPGYRTSTNVLLQGTRTTDELVTESQVATSSVVLDRTVEALGWHVTRASLEGSVSAAVGDGNIIVISGTADTPEHAQQLTDEVARQYVSFSTQLATDTGDASAQVLLEQREKLRQDITKVGDRITELQASAAKGSAPDAAQLRSELEQLRTTLTQSMTKLDQSSGGAGQGNIVVMGLAERPSSRAAPTLVQLAGGGALVALVIGVFGHLAAARRDHRLRNGDEIAAALGAPVLATVDVPDEPAADDPAGGVGWKRRLRDLVLGRRPWYLTPPPVAGDDQSRRIRYRRALGRLRGDAVGPLRVLAVVPDDDDVAHWAATQLAAVAAAEPQPTVVEVSGVAARQPTVPDGWSVAGVLVVLATSTRTGWELVGLSEACADAGYRVLGVVVAHPTSPAGKDREESATVPGNVMVGSS